MDKASSELASGSTRDNDQAILEMGYLIADIPPGDAAEQPDKRKASPPDNGDTVCKEGKYLDNGGDKQSIEDAQSRLFSCHPTEAARSDVLETFGSGENVQDIRSFKLDRAKHKIFLSHSGTQKGFVEELCVDLEARGYLFPFFDQRHHSLPKGEDFVPLIKEAARLCQVAVIVLSEEFLCSKWPMIELAEFHGAQQAGNKQLKMLPLFYKLSVAELDDESIAKWMPSWIEHAKKDKRIDVRMWSAAVRALRGTNGLIFHKNAMTKVSYRKGVVKCISRLSPPELLYGSSQDMVGYDRMCETISNQFVKDTWTGALVLGLHGMSGVGKTTLCKALCDHFSGEFLGRVCYVELDATSRMERVKLILQWLCGFHMDMLYRFTDVGQGLRQMRELMKREPVFLAIDNVTDVGSSWKEAFEYLMVGFHPQSRIIITSRSKCILEDLLPDVKFCMPMPRLSVNEAGEIFLRSAAPMRSIFGLTDEERQILRRCIKWCLLEAEQDDSSIHVKQDDSESDLDQEDSLSESEQGDSGSDLDQEDSLSESEQGDSGSDFDQEDSLSESEQGDSGSELDEEKHVSYSERMSYHPLALLALGDFFRKYISSSHMLRWGDYLENYKDPIKDVWKYPNCIRDIIGLQFSILHPSEQLLFLDIALFRRESYFLGRCHSQLTLLSGVHGDSITVMEIKLRNLVRSGMINVTDVNMVTTNPYSVHGLYREFAEWYVSEHGVTGLKNVWGVFQTSCTSRRCDTPVSKCWSDLVRLRMFENTRANARVLGSKTMQDLYNLVVLQLHRCPYLTVLNLEGLESLRHLELVGLTKLETVQLNGVSSTDEKLGICESLRHMLLEDLDSLTRVPDVRSCTSLQHVVIWNCQNMTNFEGLQCPNLKSLDLECLVPNQFSSLPNVKALRSLEHFFVSLRTDDDLPLSTDNFMKDFHKMSCFRYLREYFLYLRKWVLAVYYWVPQDSPPLWQMRLCWKFNMERLCAYANIENSYSLTREAIEQLAILRHPDATAVIASGYYSS